MAVQGNRVQLTMNSGVICCSKSVSAMVGAMQFTVTPVVASSLANDLLKAMTPPLAAA